MYSWLTGMLSSVVYLNIVCLYSSVYCANILLSGGLGDGSHYHSMVPIGKSLEEEGHHVTFLVADVFAERAKELPFDHAFHFEVFSLPVLKEDLEKILTGFGDIALRGAGFSEVAKMQDTLNVVNRDACNSIFADEALLNRLKSFDAFVVDVVWMCGLYVQSYLERHTHSKEIFSFVVAPMTPIPTIFSEAGSPFIPSYQPAPMSMSTSSMTFLQRLSNTVHYLVFTLFISKTFHSSFTELVDRYDLDPRLKYGVSDNVELYFINLDFSLEFPFALMPNVIPVGGLTTRPADPLDKDLEQFMHSSGEHGVVIFTLGSLFCRITESRPDVIQMFIDAFGRIPQSVILHLTKELPMKLPDRIKVMSWLPLNDLLGHPRTRVFLSHGGHNAYQEAVYHGVPLVVMPLALDQFDVATRVVANELGLVIDKDRLTPDHIYEQLTEVLRNPKYSDNAKRLSAVYRHRPMTAPDKAAFWIDHVIKHGAQHLRPPTLDLNFFQIYLLDIVAFAIIFMTVICFATFRLAKYCAKYFTKRKQD